MNCDILPIEIESVIEKSSKDYVCDFLYKHGKLPFF